MEEQDRMVRTERTREERREERGRRGLLPRYPRRISDTDPTEICISRLPAMLGQGTTKYFCTYTDSELYPTTQLRPTTVGAKAPDRRDYVGLSAQLRGT